MSRGFMMDGHKYKTKFEGLRSGYSRDLVGIVIFAFTSTVFTMILDVHDRFDRFFHKPEYSNLDEIALLLPFFLAMGLAWFAFRRMQESKSELIKQQQTEKALRESENRFKDVAERTSDWIWEVDGNGVYTYASPKVKDLLGYELEEVIGKTPFDLMPPEEAERIKKKFGAIVKSQKPFHRLENTNLHKDGRYVVLDTSGVPLFDPDGTLRAYRGIDRDITERKRTEEALQKANEELETLVEERTRDLVTANEQLKREIEERKRAEEKLLMQNDLLDGINRLLQDTLKCETEDEVARTCLAVAEELTGSKFGFIGEVSPAGRFDTIAISNPGWDACKMPGSKATRLIKHMKIRGIWGKVLKDEQSLIVNDPAACPSRVGTPEGHPPITSFLGVPLKQRDKTIGMIGLANKESGYDQADQQATEALSVSFVEALSRNRAEEALLESEIKYRELVQNANSIIFRMDTEGKFTFVNEFTQEFFGFTEDELLGKSLVGTIVPEADKSGRDLAAMIGEITVHPERYANNENENMRKNGERVWVAWTNKAILDENGNVREILCIGNDITYRKRAEEALVEAKIAAEAANDAKSEFLANMSHEIRTPMNGVIGMTGLLLDTELSQEQQDYANTVRTCANSLLSIINDILDFSKIEAGKLDLEIIDFDLRTTVEDVTEMMGASAEEKGIEFAVAIDHDVPALVKGDPGRLRQIVINLVGNGIKFTESGEVFLRASLVEEDDTHAVTRFTVSDTGIGIPPEIVDSVFESFSQVDASMSRRYGGTGLGLTISKQLVERMGGQIGVESEEGKGATFWFTVIFEKRKGAALDERKERLNLKGRRILIVDDNATARFVLREQLASWGCDVEEVNSGEEALDALSYAFEEDHPYEIAILDMMMPGMDGETLGMKIKADPKISETMLVILTSMGLRGDTKRLKEMGFSAYLTKPIKGSELQDCLQMVTGDQREEKEKRPKSLVTKHTVSENRKKQIRILLAEDDMTNQRVALRIIDKFGFGADAVSNGKEAVNALKMIPYGLVFMDVQMPEMDGLEATKAIRSGQSGAIDPDIPIIAMTALVMKGDRESCLEAGMNDYISKPIEPGDLLNSIEKWLAKTGKTVETQKEVKEPMTQTTMSPYGATIDVEKALKRVMGDKAFLEDMVDHFIDKMPDHIRTLEEHLAHGDSEALSKEAHSLKGSAASLSVLRVADVALQLEQMGKEGQLNDGMEVIDRLASELENLKSFVRQPDWVG